MHLSFRLERAGEEGVRLLAPLRVPDQSDGKPANTRPGDSADGCGGMNSL